MRTNAYTRACVGISEAAPRWVINNPEISTRPLTSYVWSRAPTKRTATSMRRTVSPSSWLPRVRLRRWSFTNPSLRQEGVG
jgi:hypothetical protein